MRLKLTRRVLLIAAVITMFVATTVVSSAYFSDYETAAGRAGLHLSGETTIDEQWADGQKTILIKNTGNVDVVVRVGIFGAEELMEDPEFESADWEQSGDFLYYKKVLSPDQSTSEITAKLKAVAADENVNIDFRDFDIVVVHESVPVSIAKAGNPDGWDINPAASDN